MFKQITVAAAIVIASSSAFAQQSPAPQFYIGAEVSSTKIEDLDRENGFGGFLGYKINQHFAVEAGVHRLAETDYSYYDFDYDADVNGTVRLNQFDVSVIGTLPLSNGFNLYGRVGYNRLTLKANATASANGVSGSASESEHENKFLYGVGLSYDFTPTLVGRIELQKPENDLTKTSVGIALRF